VDRPTASLPMSSVVVGIRKGRKRLWELEEKLLCPVIGSCLTVAEVAKLLKRFDYVSGKARAFEVHVTAVGLAKTRNEVSERLHRRLDEKWRVALTQVAQIKDDEALRTYWTESFARGEVAGAFWAVVTHPLVTSELAHSCYEDLHMLSHQIGAGLAADVRRLKWLEEERTRLVQENQKLQARVHDLSQQLGERTQAMLNLKAQFDRAEEARERLVQKWRAECEMLRDAAEEGGKALARIESLKARVETLESELVAALRDRDFWREELEAIRREHAALEQLWVSQQVESVSTAYCANETECDACQYRYRCVLCVGGRTNLAPHLRDFAKRFGLEVRFHDGGLEDALQRLPEQLKGVDAVVVTVGAVSHQAYYRVKHFCKQSGKPCLLIRNASMGGFAVAIQSLMQGEVELASQGLPAVKRLTN